ncbi:MAG: UDP-N-acetylmuramoyl-L-alanine--D-glutamate ligase [Actinomycetota bacterium]|jgi:UDP-N-acetylmuramoylalanine--D-glutamate ligase|nr:UDP-N-acetylmuramoyl-L-alanine--D-glutamate ligase [Actinomycetota bacterium]
MDTPPKISWSDLAGHAVGLWGLGVEGEANLRRARALGIEPVLVDDHPPSPHVLATRAGGLEALERCDVVVKTPGISRHRADVVHLVRSGVAVTGGLGLWMQEADRSRVLVVTGTKGKSTTAAVAGHLIERLGHRCIVAGNIGTLPYDPQVDGSGCEYWVVETSSFQATDLASAPPVVAVTSLHPDHLDWHGDVETYYRDKLSVCTRPGARVTVANGDSEVLRAHRPLLGSEVRWVTSGGSAPGAAEHGADGSWAVHLGLPGRHNLVNALVARTCLVEMGVPGAVDEDALRRAAGGFHCLASRLAPLGSVAGVRFVDDSLATNVLATLAALDAHRNEPKVALIVGGFDRGIDYGPLAEGMSRWLAAREPAPHGDAVPALLVLALPGAGLRVHQAVDLGPRPAPEVLDVPDLQSATTRGFEWAKPDGVVLLSPAAPSFGQFRDYKERSAAFAAAMRTCGPIEEPPGGS